MEHLLQDLRYGARHLLRSPVFSIVAILTLALGIGAATAIFGQVNAVFWKELPVERPDELRTLAWTSRKRAFVLGPNVVSGPRLPIGETMGSFSYPAYAAMRDGASSFTDLACWNDLGEARPIVLGEFGFGSVQFISGNYFRTLGVGAQLGRTIRPEDDGVNSASAVAVISHHFWQRAFGGDRTVLSHTLALNGRSFAIVGVMREGFFGFDPAIMPDVMIPIGMVQVAAATINPLQNAGLWNVCRVVGRLRSGVSEDAARAELDPLVGDTIRARPPREEYETPRVWLAPANRGAGTLQNLTSVPMLVLLSVVLGILSIACANLAGLLLARGTARRREIATRLALGASRARLVRQLVTESVLLSALGGAAGVFAAYVLGRTAPSLISQFMPSVYGATRTLGVDVAPDARVLLAASAVVLATGLAFGLAPALHAARVDLLPVIRQSATGSEQRAGFFSGRTMVALQATLSILLLVGAGLFIRTVMNLRSTALGYDPHGLIYFKVEPRTGGIPFDRRAAFFEQAVDRIERLPGVVAASAAIHPPLGPIVTTGLALGADAIEVCTSDSASRDVRRHSVAFNVVAPKYFETMKLPIRAGRDFESRDRTGPDRPQVTPVAIVNDAFASQFFGAGHAVGQRFGVNCPSKPAEIAIVGVVADSRMLPRREAGPMVYFPLGPTSEAMTLIVRSSSAPAAMIQVVRRAVLELNANVPVFGEITPLELREQQIKQERLLADLLVAFGGVALLLASLGIYGMLAYAVNRRTTEIGLRMALGAQRIDVVTMVVRETVAPVAAGIAIGLVCALGAARWIESFLFGVSTYDPWTIGGAAAVFLLVGAGAALLPARRAARIDPLVALRSE